MVLRFKTNKVLITNYETVMLQMLTLFFKYFYHQVGDNRNIAKLRELPLPLATVHCVQFPSDLATLGRWLEEKIDILLISRKDISNLSGQSVNQQFLGRMYQSIYLSSRLLCHSNKTLCFTIWLEGQIDVLRISRKDMSNLLHICQVNR